MAAYSYLPEQAPIHWNIRDSIIGSLCSWSSASKARCGFGPSHSSPYGFPSYLNLRTDPYERADITSNTYYDWLIDHVFLMVPAQDYVGKFLMTFKEDPQRQKAASFNPDEVLQELKEQGAGK